MVDCDGLKLIEVSTSFEKDCDAAGQLFLDAEGAPELSEVRKAFSSLAIASSIALLLLSFASGVRIADDDLNPPFPARFR